MTRNRAAVPAARKRALPAALLAAALAVLPVAGAAETLISVQSRYPALQIPGALPGGAHPIGGVSKAFVDHANAALAPFGVRFEMHAPGTVGRWDEDLLPALVERSDWDGSYHNAVAAGPEAGGLVAALGIPANSGLAFGEFFSGGVPFNLGAAEFISFLYEGGGLALQQALYDEAFDGAIKVIPIAVTPGQTSGFFPAPIPAGADDEAALVAFCRTPMIVRYPGGAAAVIRAACREVGEDVASIGRGTRCEDAKAPCGDNPDNRVVNEPVRLTFGGFAPGAAPHMMAANGNIDAYELNLPTEHVAFLKIASQQAGVSDEEADLSESALPYHYLTAWHQPFLYAELVFNRDAWEALGSQTQGLIEMAARSAVLSTFANRTAHQGAALERLSEAGVTHMAWPQAMLERFRAVADDAMMRLAENKAEAGDATLVEALTAMTAFRDAEAYYLEGSAVPARKVLPESP